MSKKLVAALTLCAAALTSSPSLVGPAVAAEVSATPSTTSTTTGAIVPPVPGEEGELHSGRWIIEVERGDLGPAAYKERLIDLQLRAQEAHLRVVHPINAGIVVEGAYRTVVTTFRYAPHVMTIAEEPAIEHEG